MEEQWFDFLLAWLDPVGSHAEFGSYPGTPKEGSKADSVYRLLEELLAWQFFQKPPAESMKP